MNVNNPDILLVDDDQKNIFALSAMLASRDYKTISVTDAMACLDMLRVNKNISLVLLDMMMPGTDGYETIRMIRDIAGLEKLPVIAVTAQVMKGDREKCLQAGADDYLAKPIDVDLLFEKIQLYLNKPHEQK